jgi:hypothetical protein
MSSVCKHIKKSDLITRNFDTRMEVVINNWELPNRNAVRDFTGQLCDYILRQRDEEVDIKHMHIGGIIMDDYIGMDSLFNLPSSTTISKINNVLLDDPKTIPCITNITSNDIIEYEEQESDENVHISVNEACKLFIRDIRLDPPGWYEINNIVDIHTINNYFNKYYSKYVGSIIDVRTISKELKIQGLLGVKKRRKGDNNSNKTCYVLNSI